jgi:hypothetical protein
LGREACECGGRSCIVHAGKQYQTTGTLFRPSQLILFLHGNTLYQSGSCASHLKRLGVGSRVMVILAGEGIVLEISSSESETHFDRF